MKKSFYIILLCSLLTLATFSPKVNFAFAERVENIPEINYVVYDEKNNVLFERAGVVVGDIYIDKEFNKYTVYLVDEVKRTAKARFVEQLRKPNLTKKSFENVTGNIEDKKIALYITHNDESYLLGDGISSVYGAGGIHDIANRFADALREKNINVFVDETLHIPHDYSAYSRSRTTATKLLKNDVNAMFDIHRDGASRSTYSKWVDGKERSMIRIVVGQANPKHEQNLQFALYLLSVAESVCPWLFLDIFYATGHYNQDLYEKALLFEMGTYTIEKDMVFETVPYLAEVLNTTLFNTTVNEETGDLTIGSQTSQQEQTIDQILEVTDSPITFKFFTSSIALLGLLGGVAYFVFSYRKSKNFEV